MLTEKELGVWFDEQKEKSTEFYILKLNKYRDLENGKNPNLKKIKKDIDKLETDFIQHTNKLRNDYRAKYEKIKFKKVSIDTIKRKSKNASNPLKDDLTEHKFQFSSRYNPYKKRKKQKEL